MKKYLCCLICVVLICFLISCNSRNITVLSGIYYAVGDYEEMLTPYLWLDTKEHRFSFGASSLASYAENGTYQLVDGKIVATSQSTTYKFEIKDQNTLVLSDSGDNDFFKIPINTQFVYSKV